MSTQDRSQLPAQANRFPHLSAKAWFAGIATAALLALSACSMGDHGEEGHHDGAEGMDEHHGDAEDHHGGLAGQPGKASDVDRTVQVLMSDAMDYTPASVTVARGETVRFEVTNEGRLVHEFVLGTDEEILEHHELMKRFPGMEHEEPNSVSLESGASGDVVWQFTEAGEVTFACLQPGHYEAGMNGAVLVSDTL